MSSFGVLSFDFFADKILVAVVLDDGGRVWVGGRVLCSLVLMVYISRYLSSNMQL